MDSRLIILEQITELEKLQHLIMKELMAVDFLLMLVESLVSL